MKKRIKIFPSGNILDFNAEQNVDFPVQENIVFSKLNAAHFVELTSDFKAIDKSVLKNIEL